ncbi:L-type lectin-domain containing receptor kinase IV.1-like [Iris pallida]|uniref:L-type lectin-domain containing receptor kinase IV.1-like n=1 Tax=Iris pallida TaxID=29817 RepID=A0AAX6E518_IRIPA|nr:L-type lectin-domain containing receptor kinase IV.1-like [Iris pallida]
MEPKTCTSSSDKPGTGTSPFKYCTTCLMLGRDVATGASRAGRASAPAPPPPPRIVPEPPVPRLHDLPPLRNSSTHSTRSISSPDGLISYGLLPHATSSTNAPNPYTSEFTVAFPLLDSSGRCSPVPTTWVACTLLPCRRASRGRSPRGGR